MDTGDVVAIKQAICPFRAVFEIDNVDSFPLQIPAPFTQDPEVGAGKHYG
jgi:hypothetical protein